jgi:hypothetical protein
LYVIAMNKNAGVEIRVVVIPDDLEDVRRLWYDYLVWEIPGCKPCTAFILTIRKRR